MKKNECCGHCRYWKTVFDYARGICSRNLLKPDVSPLATAYESYDKFCNNRDIPEKTVC